ncbi:hypothetical protein A8B73_21700 [Methylosinus sp. 3S-1]|nr:hypothetical protein A8B73_21700 [Methylosinus sp. 3S-1]
MRRTDAATRSLVCIFAAIQLACVEARAEAGRVWMVIIEDQPPHWASLAYGVPETDDAFGSFRCKSQSGEVILFIAETSGKLVAGRPASATLAAGEVRATIAGKLLPNEDAGVPSFEGRIAAEDPIFLAMTSAKTLEATIGSAKQSAPLKGAADKVKRFMAACKKR